MKQKTSKTTKIEAILSALKGDDQRLRDYGKKELVVVEQVNGIWVEHSTGNPVDTSRYKTVVRLIYE
jgi:hypothetical protein